MLEKRHDTLIAADVVRGTTRLLAREECLAISEVSLSNGRRADMMGLCARGFVTIVEVKVSRADLLADDKWTDYLGYCDRFFWAIPQGFDAGLLNRPAMLPDRAGIIVADRYDAAIVREAASFRLAPARRRSETLRFARRAARRLLGDLTEEQALV